MIANVVVLWLLTEVFVIALYSAWHRSKKAPVLVPEEPPAEQILAEHLASDETDEDEYRVVLSDLSSSDRS
jgi:uncharacterized membrane protein